MRTLWLSILGNASGRTGWVITGGGEPYDDHRNPTGDEHGVFDRFNQRERREVERLAVGCVIKLGSAYQKGVWQDVTQEQIENADDLADLRGALLE